MKNAIAKSNYARLQHRKWSCFYRMTTAKETKKMLIFKYQRVEIKILSSFLGLAK